MEWFSRDLHNTAAENGHVHVRSYWSGSLITGLQTAFTRLMVLQRPVTSTFFCGPESTVWVGTLELVLLPL